MSKSKKFRKIILKSEVAIIEEEEMQNQLDVYDNRFNEDFHLEVAFLKSIEQKKNISMPAEGEEIDIPAKVSHKFLKDLHKELARILHPDFNNSVDSEEFKKMQHAYEAGDASTLISMAVKYNIDIDFSEKDILEIEKSIEEKNNKMSKKKNTCVWVWGESDKSVDMKNRIRKSLGIDQTEFEEWLTKNF